MSNGLLSYFGKNWATALVNVGQLPYYILVGRRRQAGWAFHPEKSWGGDAGNVPPRGLHFWGV